MFFCEDHCLSHQSISDDAISIINLPGTREEAYPLGMFAWAFQCFFFDSGFVPTSSSSSSSWDPAPCIQSFLSFLDFSSTLPLFILCLLYWSDHSWKLLYTLSYCPLSSSCLVCNSAMVHCSTFLYATSSMDVLSILILSLQIAIFLVRALSWVLRVTSNPSLS